MHQQNTTNNESLKTLAIIPARGGSKGVPAKNIKDLGGKPLIQYAVDCALGSEALDKIIINSDSEEILNVVNTHQSKKIIKQKRSAKLGNDQASIVDVVFESIKSLKENYDLIILMQVTSPLRTSDDINNIVGIFKEEPGVEGIISVIPMHDMHPARMYKLDKNDTLEPLTKHHESKRRQDLDPVYYRNGCFYAIRTKAFLDQNTFMPRHKKAYVMNPEHLLNIDSPRDLKLAEVLIDAWKNKTL